MMQEYYTNVTLDGVSNGIGAFVKSLGEKGEYIKRPDKKSSLFTNFSALEAKLFEDGIHYHDVSFCFMIHDPVIGKVSIPLSECRKADFGWKAAREEMQCGVKFIHIYNIYESKVDVVTAIGYIGNADSGKHDSNNESKFEYAKLKKIREYVTNVLYSIASFRLNGISITKSKQGLKVIIDNTTINLHVWTNSKLMDYNTQIKKRREEKEETTKLRCLPFKKDKDKYGTLYIFYTVDKSFDLKDDNSSAWNKIELFHQIFMSELKNVDDNVTWEGVEFEGEVILSEEAMNINDDHTENRCR